MDLSDDYNNVNHIPNGASFPELWRRASLKTIGDMGNRLSILPYGDTPRQRIHLFRPEGPSKGLFVLVHGGYWRAFAPTDFAHLSRGAVKAGWTVAMPGYDLCPTVRIRDITQQIAAATDCAAAMVDGPICLAGHSAGGHLVARMGCADARITETTRARIQQIVPISPLSDLAPLLQTDLNADLKLDAAEAEAESLLHQPAPSARVHVWVGGSERPAFLDQARWLSEAWKAPMTIDPDKHHFDVIAPLDTGGALLEACLPPD